MRRITYYQGTYIVADVGTGAQALELPQDETTAVVRMAAILARNYGARMPGEYRAIVQAQDGSAVVITEDDPRVARARDLLAAVAKNRDYTAAELELVRSALSREVSG